MQKRLPLILLALGIALLLGYFALRGSGHGGPAGGNALPSHAFRLPNGLEAEVVSDCGTNAALAVLFAVGANNDPPGRSGMVHVVEQLLSASAGKTSRIIESGSDHTSYSVAGTPEEILTELDAFAARIAQPDFSDAAFRAAQAKVLEEIAQRSGSDPSLTAQTYAAESVLPSRGSGRRGGIATEVKAIDVAAVKSFWQTYFAAGNARVVVLGHVDAEKVRARIEQAFGKLPAGTPPVLRPAGDMTVAGTLVMGDAPTAVAVAVRAPPLSDRTFPSFLLTAARLLGAAPGWSVSFDPVIQPELLFVTGPVQQEENPELAAARIRNGMAEVLKRPLTPTDTATARQKFGLFLGVHELDAGACADNPRGLAVARARRSQLGMDKLLLGQVIDGITPKELADGVAVFAPARTAAVIGGGVIR